MSGGYPQDGSGNYRKKDIGVYRFGRLNDRKDTAEIRDAPRPIDRGGRDQLAVDNFLEPMTYPEARPNDRDWRRILNLPFCSATE